MAGKLVGKAIVGQSGGPTCVINQSLVGVIQEAAEHSQITGLLGAKHGVRGIVQEDFVDLTRFDSATLEKVAITPSAALGSTRDKPDEQYCRKIFEVFRKNDVKYFFYAGGNDSAHGADIIDSLARQARYELRVYHIPKTIDNDLLITDHCPGYGSAAKFVACAVMGDDLDNRSLAGVKIDVIMGRHAGFLTAATILARDRQDSSPHLIYVPEVDFDQQQFISDIDSTMGKYGRCVAAVSEGIHDASGEPITTKVAQLQEQDDHGNVQLSGTGALGDYLAGLVRTALGKQLRVRADTFGYLQRSFPGFYSTVDAQEARLVGQMAVRYALEAQSSGSVAIRRLSVDGKYAVETFSTALASVARKTKCLPSQYIAVQGKNILDSYREYVAPLVGQLPQKGYLY